MTTRTKAVFVAALTLIASGWTIAGASPSRPLTTGTGTPADGVIAFVDDRTASSNEQIYLENADGSNVRQLVTSGFNDVEPAISPDGTTVLFTRMNDPSPDRMFMVNVDGSGLHRLIPGGCPSGSRCGDAVEGHPWSPDGRQIVFTRAIFRGSHQVPNNVGLWIMNADGSDAHQVTLANVVCPNSCLGGAQDDNAGWSPDGTRLVFRRWEYTAPDRFGIFTVALDGSDLQRVTPVSLNAEDPAWSPDGSLIVFQSPPDPYVPGAGRQILYSIHPDGTGLIKLTGGLRGPATNHPSWSPDGAWVIFSHARAGEVADLYLMRPDGSHLHRLAGTALNENAPDWGKALAT